MSTQNQTVPHGFAAYGGLAGIATPVVALVAFGLTMSVDVPAEDGIRPLADATAGHVDQLVASSWLYLLTGVGLSLFAAFLMVRWRRASGWVVPAATTLLAATTVLFFDNLLAIGVWDIVVPAVAEQDPPAGPDLIAVGDALDIIILSGHRLHQGLLGLAVLLGGLALLGGVSGPRWLGYLGLVAGVALVAYAATRAAPLLMAGAVLFGAWTVAVGGWSTLTRWGGRPGTRPPAGRSAGSARRSPAP